MRDFKKAKARELYLASLRVEDNARQSGQEDIKEIGRYSHSTSEMFREAAGLRVLADDVEDGFIDEEEIEL